MKNKRERESLLEQKKINKETKKQTKILQNLILCFEHPTHTFSSSVSSMSIPNTFQLTCLSTLKGRFPEEHESLLQEWLRLVFDRRRHYTSPSEFEFYLDELLPYVTLDDIRQGSINLQPEVMYVESLYRQRAAEMTASDHSSGLQKPEVTFGAEVKVEHCHKCKIGECEIQIRQLRSGDEPAETLYICKRSLCKHIRREKQ